MTIPFRGASPPSRSTGQPSDPPVRESRVHSCRKVVRHHVDGPPAGVEPCGGPEFEHIENTEQKEEQEDRTNPPGDAGGRHQHPCDLVDDHGPWIRAPRRGHLLPGGGDGNEEHRAQEEKMTHPPSARPVPERQGDQGSRRPGGHGKPTRSEPRGDGAQPSANPPVFPKSIDLYVAHVGYLLLYVNKNPFSNDGMTEPPKTPDDLSLQRVTQAVTEFAKGIKSASFYPAGHPVLLHTVTKIIQLLEAVPLPEQGLSIDVTKNALFYRDVPLPSGGNKAVLDLNRELYLRRASRIIFLPNLQPDEVVSCLKIITLDPDEIQDAGGLERILLREKVARIWANRVDYDQLTQLLKEEELEEVQPEELTDDLLAPPDTLLLADAPPEEVVTIETLIARIAKETDPSAYRGHIVEFSRLLLAERAERKIEFSMQAMAIFIQHIQTPPGGSGEIGGLARLGIKEVASEELVTHYIGLLK